MNSVLLDRLREAVSIVPAVRVYLSNRARFALCIREPYKTFEFMLAQIRRLVTSLYNNQVGGEFIDIMANIISGQLYDAYSKAWFDYGETGALPEYLESAYQDDVLTQYAHVDKYYRDIIDARVDETPIEPLLSRAELWANRWNESYNKAAALIKQEEGGNLIWEYGETEHCDTCRSLNGIVASAKEWGAIGVRPQNAPNSLIDCGGWNCQCTLLPTDKRRSPKAFDTLLNIIVGRGL